MTLSLEALFTSPAAFKITTATPLQRAICRAAAGEPFDDLLTDAERSRFFGSLLAQHARPALMTLVCGVRSGKSVMAGAAALHGALTADLSKLPKHERARIPIVAPTVSTAALTYRLLVGAVESAPALKALVAPKSAKARDVGIGSGDTITIRRADGRLIDIIVTAAHRGAVTMRGSWLCGFILEETSNFGADEHGYRVNAEEILRAAETRLVPGAQGWIISSPMGASGLLHDLWKVHFGSPGRVLVVHAPTLSMNSVSVDAAAVEAVRRRDPDGASREFDAIFTDSDSNLIPAAHIDAALRKGEPVLSRQEGHSYAAAIDPAVRGNSWTLCVATRARREDRVKHVVVLARQWQGSKVKPLSPDKVLKEQAELLAGYGVTSAATDQFSADALRDIARRHGLVLYDRAATNADNLEMYESLRVKFADGLIELPDDAVVRSDLLSLRKRVTSTISIVLPRTPDGRHCDYAPALARVVSMSVREPPPVPVILTPEERVAAEEAEARAYAKGQADRRLRGENRRIMKSFKKGRLAREMQR